MSCSFIIFIVHEVEHSFELVSCILDSFITIIFNQILPLYVDDLMGMQNFVPKCQFDL